MYGQPQQKAAPTFGGVQQNFQYRLRNFIINDQFTIVEDLPRTKPIRQAQKAGSKGQYTVFLIRISSNNFEADLELFEGELNNLAIACPKDTQNFKGITLAFDGRKWVYICSDAPSDPRQPNLYPNPQTSPISQPQQSTDQKSLFMAKMIGSMRALESVGVPCDISKLTLMCESISPGNALQLISTAKGEGRICEKDGKYVVVE